MVNIYSPQPNVVVEMSAVEMSADDDTCLLPISDNSITTTQETFESDWQIGEAESDLNVSTAAHMTIEVPNLTSKINKLLGITEDSGKPNTNRKMCITFSIKYTLNVI